ncbi:hypothetical protein [Bacillus sp. FJAT-26390]|uniref:hypothetical protein n=1 Tax=Bacillus sp. FJAT-26390 TaxID=1743142 RepID=UPI000808183C|nr:hypothetical protein [Bacillus sp. FJAT-26390]OBZ08023.1 hypothetical protein A7975_27220 [Bacillus sp. FJAT-26390]
MRLTEQARQTDEQMQAIRKFLGELDDALSEIVDELSEADESNALARCKSVHDKLDGFFQRL